MAGFRPRAEPASCAAGTADGAGDCDFADGGLGRKFRRRTVRDRESSLDRRGLTRNHLGDAFVFGKAHLLAGTRLLLGTRGSRQCRQLLLVLGVGLRDLLVLGLQRQQDGDHLPVGHWVR